MAQAAFKEVGYAPPPPKAILTGSFQSATLVGDVDGAVDQVVRFLAPLQTVRAVRVQAMEREVTRILQKEGGFASGKYLAGKLGISRLLFEQFVQRSTKVTKSMIVLEDGREVYRLRTPFGWFRDLFRAVVYVNSQEFHAWFK